MKNWSGKRGGGNSGNDLQGFNRPLKAGQQDFQDSQLQMKCAQPGLDTGGRHNYRTSYFYVYLMKIIAGTCINRF